VFTVIFRAKHVARSQCLTFLRRRHTLVEAALHGHNSSDSKSIHMRRWQAAPNWKPPLYPVTIPSFHREISEHMANDAPLNQRLCRLHFQHPDSVLRRAYSAKGSTCLRFIGDSSSSVRDLFNLAFGSVMVSLSNYSYEPSLSSRLPSANRCRRCAGSGNTFGKTSSDALRYRMAQSQDGAIQTRTKGCVIADSFMNAGNHLKPTQWTSL